MRPFSDRDRARQHIPGKGREQTTVTVLLRKSVRVFARGTVVSQQYAHGQAQSMLRAGHWCKGSAGNSVALNEKISQLIEAEMAHSGGAGSCEGPPAEWGDASHEPAGPGSAGSDPADRGGADAGGAGGGAAGAEPPAGLPERGAFRGRGAQGGGAPFTRAAAQQREGARTRSSSTPASTDPFASASTTATSSPSRSLRCRSASRGPSRPPSSSPRSHLRLNRAARLLVPAPIIPGAVPGSLRVDKLLRLLLRSRRFRPHRLRGTDHQPLSHSVPGTFLLQSSMGLF